MTRTVLHRLLALALLPAAAFAQPRGEPTGAVLRIDGRDVYVDVGRAAGATPGMRLRVMRPVTAMRPGTQQLLEDRFALGELELAEVGEVLSRARPESALARAIRLGDRVDLPQPAPADAAPAATASAARGGAPPCQPAPSKEARLGDVEAAAFRQAWLGAQGLPAARRAEHWQSWLAMHPSGALADAIRSEVAALRAVAARPGGAERLTLPAELEPTVTAPRRSFEGDPIEVVLTFPGRSAPRAASLNWRPAGEPLYQPIAFAGEGRHWRARLPREGARSPAIEYWVGIVDEAGGERPRAGTPDAPARIEVLPTAGGPSARRTDRSEVGLWTDYADWNRFRGNDYHWNLEGEFLYRVLSDLHSLKLGFGLYQGRGQSLESAIANERAAGAGTVHYDSVEVGYNYVFTEFDIRASELIGLVAKGIAGVDRNGLAGGIEGKLRIGRDPGTHLVIGVGFTEGIGNRNEISLAWDAVRGWPMMATVVVTNEPVGEDYGVRFVWQVGRSLNRWFDLSARLGYELRDIDHAGFGIGLAGRFHW